MSYLLYVISNLKVSSLSLEAQFNINLIFKRRLLLSDIWKLVTRAQKKANMDIVMKGSFLKS